MIDLMSKESLFRFSKDCVIVTLVFLFFALFVSRLEAETLQEPPIRLHIVFDAKAAQKINDAKEMVEVAAWYEGEPTAKGQPYLQEIGLVYLGGETYEIFARDQEIRLGGAAAGLARDLVIEPMLTVNIYTARQVFEDNLLDCGLVSGTLTELAGQTHQVTCKLIGD